MRNMLAFLAAMTLAFGCTGWYLNWFSFHTVPASSGHQSVTVDFNTPKIAADFLSAEQKIQQKLAEKAQDATPPPTTVAQPAPKTTPAGQPTHKEKQDLSFPVIDLSTAP